MQTEIYPLDELGLIPMGQSWKMKITLTLRLTVATSLPG